MSLTKSYVKTVQQALATVENFKRIQSRVGSLFDRVGMLDRRLSRDAALKEFGDIQVEIAIPSASTSHRQIRRADES